MFSPKPNGQTDIRTDISIYRVASLLIIRTDICENCVVGINPIIMFRLPGSRGVELWF